jgi:hypothetical protein
VRQLITTTANRSEQSNLQSERTTTFIKLKLSKGAGAPKQYYDPDPEVGLLWEQAQPLQAPKLLSERHVRGPMFLEQSLCFRQKLGHKDGAEKIRHYDRLLREPFAEAYAHRTSPASALDP